MREIKQQLVQQKGLAITASPSAISTNLKSSVVNHQTERSQSQ